MNPDDVLKAAPAIAKGATAVGAAIPFTAIAKRILGPAVDEIGEMMRDQVRLYRYGRQLACVHKAAKMAEDAGFQPSAVPPKVLFPLLEGASFEEDEDLHTMWAALLANAASPGSSNKVRPSFAALLKQLAPDEAVFLNWLYRDAARLRRQNGYRRPEWFELDLRRRYAELVNLDSDSDAEFDICVSTLGASFLIQRFQYEIDKKAVPMLRLTFRGARFIAACLPPSKTGRKSGTRRGVKNDHAGSKERS
jgi:hypothetical protein